MDANFGKFSQNFGKALGANAQSAGAVGAGAINGVAGIASAAMSALSALTQSPAETGDGLHAQQEAVSDNKANSTATGIVTTVISIIASILCLI